MSPIAKDLLSAVEDLVAKLIAEKLDEVVEQGIVALKEAIPGQFDDMVLEAVKVQVKAALKAEALKLADLIDSEVG